MWHSPSAPKVAYCPDSTKGSSTVHEANSPHSLVSSTALQPHGACMTLQSWSTTVAYRHLCTHPHTHAPAHTPPPFSVVKQDTVHHWSRMLVLAREVLQQINFGLKVCLLKPLLITLQEPAHTHRTYTQTYVRKNIAYIVSTV